MTWLTVISGAAGRRLLAAWIHPIGIDVLWTKDDGIERATRTRSRPWMLGDGTPVILLEGISGGYALSRVRIPTEKRSVHLAAGQQAYNTGTGCTKTKLSRADALTGDLNLVTCKRCLKVLEGLARSRGR